MDGILHIIPVNVMQHKMDCVLIQLAILMEESLACKHNISKYGLLHVGARA